MNKIIFNRKFVDKFEMKDIICCLAILPDGFNIFEEKQKRMCLNSFRERLRRLQRISK